MNEYNYLATKEDFEAIEEGIKTVWSKNLSFIFRDKKLITDTLIVSFDSKYIYFWTNRKIPKLKVFPCSLKHFYAYIIPHSNSFPENERLGWHTGNLNPIILSALPSIFKQNDFDLPKISGSLMGDFINVQKKIKRHSTNPYTTRGSYLATLVHEFAHVYFNQHKLWWYSNKETNISSLNKALQLYKNKKIDNVEIPLPSPFFLSEVFAFCADYTAASIFWPEHKKDIDNKNIKTIEELIRKEKTLNLNEENSTLNEREPHNIAFVFGKILVESFPKTWPKKILTQKFL